MATALRVLILEDNPSDAELMLHALRRAGYDPTSECVETEEDYRAQLQKAPEIILADFSMPHFDALRALEIMRECGLAIPFIVVSGSIGEERAVQIMKHGATDYVIKDRMGRLGQAVTQTLETRALLRETLHAERRLLAQHAVTRALAESPSLATACSKILRAICDSLSWDFGALWQFDATRNVLHCVDCWSNPLAPATEFEEFNRHSTFATDNGFLGRIWGSRQPVWVADFAKDLTFPRAPFAAAAGLHAAFGFPIVLGTETLGIIEFMHREIKQPDDEKLKMMMAIGSQLAQYIERKRTEASLRQSEARIQELTANIQQVLWMVDIKEAKVVYISSGYEQMWGRTCQSLLDNPSTYVQGVHPQDLEMWWQADAQMYRTGHIDSEYRILRPDGSMRWVWARGYPVKENDQIVRIVGVVEDITEKRRVAAQRDALLARLQLHIERMPLAYLLFDADFRIIDWNLTAERIFGHSKEEMLGQGPPFEQIVPKSNWPQAEIIRNRMRSGDMNAHVLIENLTKDGRTIHCQWFNTPLMEGGNCTGFLCLAQDVTERKSLEEQLRQSQKMDAVGQLAGGVAHDFNNLLTIINGYSEMIHAQVLENSPVREFVREISHAGERATGLTRQLLAFSRKAVLEPKVLNLNIIVADTERMLGRLIGEDINVAAILDPALGRVKADQGQIEQVIINLAVNARDAMPRGGKLTIETSNTELDDSYTQMYTDLRSGPYVLLAVADTGTGMDATTKARIFEPFFTTKERGRGTGLGLATVFGIVKQSEGHLAVYTELGCGTTFKIYLPRIPDMPGSGVVPRPRTVVRGTQTILLTEDEPALRALARRVLGMHGYKILEASNGEKALAVATEHKGTIHLLVTDVVMPGISGRQLAEQLVAVRPEMKVLYVSGYTDDAVVRHGVLQADTAFLQKPFTPASLAQKVWDVLEQ
ncbi:MAG: PAS domain S-box protein [Planctomycetes bacterium]|nr:PAS domain S-box protein [Planctomycetota bacterium]